MDQAYKWRDAKQQERQRDVYLQQQWNARHQRDIGMEREHTANHGPTVAFALDWARPPRQMQATSFFYLVTDQFRYDELETLGWPLGGRFTKTHPAEPI